MLTIRTTQLAAFDRQAEAAFERRVAAYVREEHGGEVVTLPPGGGPAGEREVGGLDAGTLLRMARTGIARARSYGMRWESSITAFVALMFVVAPNFDEHPLIRRVLEDHSVAPDERLDALWGATNEENWEAAGRGYRAEAWGLGPQEGLTSA